MIIMKIRNGFVSNSSSGSFIFPKGISEKKAEIIIRQIEEFLTNLKGEKVESGTHAPIHALSPPPPPANTPT
jgi:hypothetical protein